MTLLRLQERQVRLPRRLLYDGLGFQKQLDWLP